MKKCMEKLEAVMELGGMKKDIVFLILSGIALLCSIFKLLPLPFDAAWVAIILCGIPIVMEAIIGTLTPVVGALVHNAGSVLVITNSAFLLKWRKKS